MSLFGPRRLHSEDRRILATIREEQRNFGAILVRINAQQEKIMIDTSKILAEVARERTESASLRALIDGLAGSVKDLAKKLADAIAANDPAAMAQVQADLDKAATDLSTDNDADETAIRANTPAPPQPGP